MGLPAGSRDQRQTKGQSEKYVADGHGYVAEHCTVAAVPCFLLWTLDALRVGAIVKALSDLLMALAYPDLRHKAACWTVLLSLLVLHSLDLACDLLSCG